MDTYKRIINEIGNISLVAVTKGQPLENILPLYEAGCRDFGESKLREAFSKMEESPKDIKWHLIGTLQKNKVRKVIGRFHLIHSVDSFDLALKISDCSQKLNMVTDILLQVNISKEPAKHGFREDELLADFEKLQNLPAIKIKGLMTMAPLTDDESIICHCFRGLKLLQEKLMKQSHHPLNILSMGMSSDYKLAIQEGTTLLRLGSTLFTSDY